MKDGVLRNVLHINLMSASMGIGYKGSSQYTWNKTRTGEKNLYCT